MNEICVAGEIHYVCEELALTNRLVSMDLVEVRTY